jgi:S1-C subfamily serine protease
MKHRRLISAVVGVVALLAPLAVQPTLALDKKGIQRVSRAAVQLGPVAIVKSKSGQNELKYFGWGSGTLLRGGYILTNQHVTDIAPLVEQTRSNKNVKVLEGRLVVMLTKRSDEPPVASYIAEVLSASAELDLAVLRIRYDLSGKEVDPDQLDLPYIDLGDSDTLDLGDNLNIFGYPGIGGDTITFTDGKVSGFSAEGNIPRGWIKTDASISGGNSGGTGVNDEGDLVGIPTRGGAGNNENIVDCRPVTDTNGDGRVDGSDTCVTIGGFINSLRPVNLAKPFIQEAFDGGTTNNSGNNGTNTDPNPNNDKNRGSQSDGVTISGVIVDAATGKPVAGAIFVVLNEGLNWSNAEGNDDEIYDQVVTDRKGQFSTSAPLLRGSTYSVGWAAKNYKPVLEDDVQIGNDTPDVVEVTLKLQKK